MDEGEMFTYVRWLLDVLGFCETVKLAAIDYITKFAPRDDMLFLANGNTDVPDDVERIFRSLFVQGFVS